jgi:hypothetical protein
MDNIGILPQTAAWKLLGNALAQAADIDGARAASVKGIADAAVNGDKQAAKEMAVYLKRLDRTY